MKKCNARSKHRSIGAWCCAVLAVAAIRTQAHGGITTYGNSDRDAWFDDVGAGATSITTIGFDDLGNAIVTDQYAHFGVIFDGDNGTIGEDFGIYNDGWGLRGQPNIAFEFDSPRNAIAADYPGSIRFSLYLDGDLVGIEDFFTINFGNFAGLVSEVSFDSVVVERAIATGDPTFIDDLHFATIPAPSALVPVLIVSLYRCRGRRRAQHHS